MALHTVLRNNGVEHTGRKCGAYWAGVEHTGLDGGGREESELAVASDQEGCSAAFTKRGCKVKMET